MEDRESAATSKYELFISKEGTVRCGEYIKCKRNPAGRKVVKIVDCVICRTLVVVDGCSFAHQIAHPPTK